MNERQLEKFKEDWKKWARAELFTPRGVGPSPFNFEKAITHLRLGRQKIRELASAVDAWHPIFPQRLLPQDKYQSKQSPTYWRTKFEDNLVEADEGLVKGVRHLETLLGYYETEQETSDTSYLEDFAERADVPLDKLIQRWGREDFDDSVEVADKILSNRTFRNLKTMMEDLRGAERMMKTSARVAFFQGASEAELALEELFGALLPDSPYEGLIFAVGGYVRDEVVGVEPHDLDLVVEAQYGAQRFAGYLHELFPRETTEPEPRKLDYPIWSMSFTQDVEFEGQSYAVAGAELDLSDTQALQDDLTVFGPLSEDVQRRDFTANMLFKDLTTGEILDPTGYGLRDIQKGLLRVYPDQQSLDAFQDEPKRMLRLVRFMARYEWLPTPEVEQALEEAAPALLDMSAESIEKELGKLHADGVLDEGLELLEQYGLLPYIRQATGI